MENASVCMCPTHDGLWGKFSRCIYYLILPGCIWLQFWAGLPGFGAQSSCLIKKFFGMIKLCSVKTCHMPGVRHCEGARYVYPAGSWMADAPSRYIILYVSRGAVKASHTVYVCQCVVKEGGYIYHVCQASQPWRQMMNLGPHTVTGWITPTNPQSRHT